MGPDERRFIMKAGDTLMLLAGIDPEETWLGVRVDGYDGAGAKLTYGVDPPMTSWLAVGDTITFNMTPTWAEQMNIARPVTIRLIGIDGTGAFLVDPSTERDHIVAR
jgi:hypothetical protein